MKKSEFEFIVNHQVEKMVEFLIEDYNMPMKEAFDRIYSSDVYLKLQNKRPRTPISCSIRIERPMDRVITPRLCLDLLPH